MKKTALFLTLALFAVLAPAAFADAPATVESPLPADCASQTSLQTPASTPGEVPGLIEAPVEATPGCYQWEVDACNEQCAPDEGVLIFRHFAPCECICSSSS